MRAALERIIAEECTHLIVANLADKRCITTERCDGIDGVGGTAARNHGLTCRGKSMLNREVLLMRNEVHTALGEGELTNILIAHKEEDISKGVA